MNWLRGILFAAFAIVLLAAPAASQTAPAPAPAPAPSGQPAKTVAVRLIEPFVMKNGEAYSGFSIDLWREIERELGGPRPLFPGKTSAP